MNEFAKLIDERYLAVGFALTSALYKVNLETGCSLGAIRAAYRGTRVNVRTAAALVRWARQMHNVELSEWQLVSAPPREK